MNRQNKIQQPYLHMDIDNRAGRKPADLEPQNQHFPTGTTHLFGIGINIYPNWPNLNNAVRDVEAVAAILQRRYGVQLWKLLLNEEATRKHIIRELDALMKQVRAPDSIIVYFAGHGHIDRETQLGAWIPTDADKEDKDLYIANSTLRDFFQVAKAQHVLFISDACFSGSLLQERRGGGEELLLQELVARPSRWVMCSGRHDEEVADGPRDGHSPFAQAILDELEHNQKPGLSAAAFAQNVQLQSKSYYKNQLSDYGPVCNAGDMRGQLVLWQGGYSSELTPIPDHKESERDRSDHNPDTNPATTMTFEDFKRTMKGLERTITLKVRIINSLRESLAMEDDPIRKIRYGEQLYQAEEELGDLKAKLG